MLVPGVAMPSDPMVAFSRTRCPRCYRAWVQQDIFIDREKLYRWGIRIMTGYGPGTARLRLVCEQGHVFEATAVEEGETWWLLDAVEQPGTASTF